MLLLGSLGGIAAEPRLNVVFIIVDDLRPELGCYGADHVRSPHIDRFGSGALRFERAYCQQAVCNPSRTSLLTGMRPDSIGVVGNHSHFRTENPDVITLPQYFKQQGYHSVGVGKIFHGVFPEGASKTRWDTMGDPPSWSKPAIRFGPRYYYTETGIAAAKQAFRKSYKPLNPGQFDWTKKLVFGLATEAPDVLDNRLYDGKVADAAVKELRDRQKDQVPFFLAVGFIKPHSPFVAPKKYFDWYEETGLASKTDFPVHAPGYAGHDSSELRRYSDQPAQGPISKENQHRLRHAYFACVSYIDAQVGRVLKTLTDLGLEKNTIVVLCGDHGYHLGEQGLWGKTTNFESDTRVPLIVKAPGMKAVGQSSHSLVELVDLYPTVVEMAGLPRLNQLEGKSFAKTLDNPEAFTKEVALSQFPRKGGLMGYSMRTADHRLTQWIDHQTGEIRGTELYDYAEGLVETRNLAASSSQLVAKLAPDLIKAFAASFVSSPVPHPPVRKTSFQTEETTSFEQAVAGGFDELATGVGKWRSEIGKTLIDNQHSKTGKQCLQLTGGAKTSVILDLGEEIDTTGELTFWAERWTARKPFLFRIEKQGSNGWQEIYNGDAHVRVGREFLNHVKVKLADKNIKTLRFICSSPPNTGILIDDLRISPARRQKIESIEILPMTLPVLVGNDAGALLKLKIKTTGQLEPISLIELRAKLQDHTEIADVSLWQVRHSSGDKSRFLQSNPVGSIKGSALQEKSAVFSLARESCQLVEGTNYIWIACRLQDDADIDHRVGVVCQQLKFSNGKTVKLSPVPSVQRIGVALRNHDDDGVHTFRIPGLVTSKTGTLISVYDVRRRSGGDLPGDVDVGMSRSTDGGRSWEPMKVIMDMGNDPAWRYDGVGDPAILVDSTTGTIWVAATWSHGNRSWRGSGPGLTPDETGQLMLVRSDDDGLTWSKPINITSQVKKPAWCFILQGPGKGITMRDGTLVFAAQYQDPPDKNRLPHSTIIYSKDHGKNWQVGTSAFDDTTEAQVVEIEPGVLMLNCRFNRKAVRVVMTSRDLGRTWQKHPTSERSLVEPGACMASLIDVDREVGKDLGNWLLFSNPDSTAGRHHITIKASPDRGLTWPKEHRLLLDEENSAGYSCLSMIDEQTIGILYEGSQAHMTFQRIPLANLINNSDNDLLQQQGAGIGGQPLDIYIVTGQSNSLGTVDPRDIGHAEPDIGRSGQLIPLFWSNRSSRGGDGKSFIIGDSGGRFLSLRAQQGEGSHPVFWGPEIGFAQKLADSGQQDFAVIKASRGGGGNSFWLKGSRDDHMYQHLITTVKEAVSTIPNGRPFRIRAVLYIQGESDSETEAKLAGERIAKLITNLRRDLPHAKEARLLVGGIAVTGSRRNVVRNQQAAEAARNEAIEYIDNSDLKSQLYDGLHFNKNGKLIAGQRLAERWLRISKELPGALRLPACFGSHMVLQSKAPLPVWGHAKPGSEVLLRLGSQQRKTTVNSQGEWRVEFPPQAVSATATSLTIESGKERLELKDILIGEVWICAGQSNMEWSVAQSVNGKKVLSEKTFPNIRLLHLVGGAGGSSGVYTAQHLARLTPGAFCEGHWQVASPESLPGFSAVAWYFGSRLQQQLNVPIGLICPAVGGTPTEAWISREALAADSDLKGLVCGNWLDNERLGDFCRSRGHQNLLSAIQAGDSIPGDGFGPNHSFKPGFMWAAGIKPLVPFAIQGAIWYQGESNAETRTRVREHGRLFPLLIQQWRAEWGQGDFPFLFVQLPALNRPQWPWFREGQRRMLGQLNNVGMAITIDIGHPTNVHPMLKKPVGDRLANWALGTIYRSKTHANYSGPLLDVVHREGGSLVVDFEHVADGLRSLDGHPIRHFEICGENQVFHPAKVELKDSNSIELTSPQVGVPLHVRYAWLPYPDPPVNLGNSAGLPASPFSTESEESLYARLEQDQGINVDTRRRPNILLIVGEDHGCELSCYGDPVIETPSLDRLASQGVLFENGYVTQSVCSPSRSTLFTGLYPHQNGQLGLATHNYRWFRKWPTTYSLLKKAGYRTGLIGKTHVIPAEAVEDFVDFRFQKTSNFSKKKVAEYAVQAGKFFRDGNAPFFMTVNYPDAHWPLQNTVDGLPKWPVDPEKVKLMPYVGSSTLRLRGVAESYYNSMLRLDACVGQLLAELDASGKAENTLVVFVGDHGAQMARGKVTVYEAGLHVPFLIRWPGVTRPKRRSRALVSTIDLLPTFLDAAGIEAQVGLPGQTLRSVLQENPQERFRNYLVCERNCDAARHTFPQRTLRDIRYKLIYSPVRDREDPAARYYRDHGAGHWTGCLSEEELAGATNETKQGYERWLHPPEYQLYDLWNDPYEWNDLSGDKEFSVIINRLQDSLREWEKKTDDPLADPKKLRLLMQENDEVVKNRLRSPAEGWRYLSYLAPTQQSIFPRDQPSVEGVLQNGHPGNDARSLVK